MSARAASRASATSVGGPPAGRPGEVRLPATVATVIALTLYATLPNQLLGAASFAVAGLLMLLLIPIVAANPTRMTRKDRWLRVLSLVFAVLVLLANAAAFTSLVHALVSGHAHSGDSLLLAALQVWLVNIIGFGLLYWELDRGGPVTRSTSPRSKLPAADWRFSQDENDDASDEVALGAAKAADWRPRFVDYLYLSTTNSTAFSPTDTMPTRSPREASDECRVDRSASCVNPRHCPRRQPPALRYADAAPSRHLLRVTVSLEDARHGDGSGAGVTAAYYCVASVTSARSAVRADWSPAVDTAE